MTQWKTCAVLVLSALPLAHQTIAAGAFDGTYIGNRRELRNDNGGRCAHLNKDSRIVIRNDTIRYAWSPPFVATVAADGTFSVDELGLAARGASASVSLKGQIVDGDLEADVGGSRCAAHLSLKKQ